MRTPGLSTSATVVSGDPFGTAYTPSIRTYGAVNVISAARAGSIARKQMSACPVTVASNDSRAAVEAAELGLDAEPGGDLVRYVDRDARSVPPACPEPGPDCPG